MRWEVQVAFENTALLVRGVWKYSVWFGSENAISALQQLGFSHPFTILVCMVSAGNSCACGDRPWLPTINRAVFLGVVMPSRSCQDSNVRIFPKNRQHWIMNLLCGKKGFCNEPEGIFHCSPLNVWLTFIEFGLRFSVSEVFYIQWLGIWFRMPSTLSFMVAATYHARRNTKNFQKKVSIFLKCMSKHISISNFNFKL